MDPRPFPADKTPIAAPLVGEPLDWRAESFRTASAIHSMLALLPMHVSGAYRAEPLPPGMLPRTSKKK